MEIDAQTIVMLSMVVPSVLGTLKVISKYTKNTWDDKLIEVLESAFKVLVPKKK